MITVIRSCFCFISAILFFTALQAQGNFKIIGTTSPALNGAEILFVNITNWKEKYNRERITTSVERDSFLLNGNLLNPFEYYALSIKLNGITNSYLFFINSDTNMRLYIDKISTEESDSNIRYTNIPFDRENLEYIRFTRPTEDNLMRMYRKHSELVSKNENTKDFVDYLKDSVREARANWMNSNLVFIKSHIDSYVSLYNFNKEFVDFPKAYIHPDSLLQIYSMFTKELKETVLGKRIYTKIIKKQKLLAGNEIPNFNLIVNDSLRFNVHKFKNNNAVLLCFWASWCLPCVENIPFLKTVDSIYAPLGLKLISISTDTDESRWREALDKYNMHWLQVRDVPPNKQGSKIQQLLDIDKIPQYFLIKKDMVLVYRNTDVKDDDHAILLKRLKEIFGK